MNTQNSEHAAAFDQARGFLAGLAAGALLGSMAGAGAMWLLAPQAGEKTRASIQHKSRDLRHQTAGLVEDAVGQARVKARQITEGVQEQAGKLQQRGKDVLDEQMEQASAAVNGAKKAAHRARG